MKQQFCKLENGIFKPIKRVGGYFVIIMDKYLSEDFLDELECPITTKIDGLTCIAFYFPTIRMANAEYEKYAFEYDVAIYDNKNREYVAFNR